MAEKEYIERDMCYQEINELSKGGGGDYSLYRLAINDCMNVLDEMPTADVVEVVRCKECKHYQNHPNGLCYLHTEPYGDGYKGDAVCVEPNGFCSYGKRREPNDDT